MKIFASLSLQAALAHGVMAGRKGYGSIYVVASGNGGHFKDNCNFDGYANSIFTVTIGETVFLVKLTNLCNCNENSAKMLVRMVLSDRCRRTQEKFQYQEVEI